MNNTYGKDIKILKTTYHKPKIIKLGSLQTETLGNSSGGRADKKSGTKKPKR